jgi:hypothetical protein
MKFSNRLRFRFSFSAMSWSNAGIGIVPTSLTAKGSSTAQGEPFDVAVEFPREQESGLQCRVYEIMLFDRNENGLEAHGDLQFECMPAVRAGAVIPSPRDRPSARCRPGGRSRPSRTFANSFGAGESTGIKPWRWINSSRTSGSRRNYAQVRVELVDDRPRRLAWRYQHPP